MSDYRQVERTVSVPPESGVDGFLLAIRNILSLSRVTELKVHGKCEVTYTRWVRSEDEANANLRMDFESVTPFNVIRNNEIVDYGIVSDYHIPTVVLCNLIHKLAEDHFYPTAFVIGANSGFFDWLESGGVSLPKNANRVLGYQLLRDRFVDDVTVLLGAAYGPGGSIIDTRVTYRLLLPMKGAVDDAIVGSDDPIGFDQRVTAVRAPSLGFVGHRPAGTTATLDVSGGGPVGAGPTKR